MDRVYQRKVTVFVIEQHEGGKMLKCSLRDDEKHPFFLPKSQIVPSGRVFPKNFVEFSIPEWLCLNHRQICGDEAFEAEKKRRARYDRIKP